MEKCNHAKYQYISSNIASIGTLICGLINGWSSTAIPILQSPESPLTTGEITVEQISTIASISNIGGCLGTFFFGYLTDTFGRKKILCVLTIPSLISFLLIVFADNVYELYVSRFLGGVASGGSYIVAPLYIIEISETEIRGYLSSKVQLFYNLGIFMAFLVGTYSSYQTTAIIYCTVPVIYGILAFFLRESPYYLMRHDKVDEAVDNFRFFRSIKKDQPLEPDQQLEMNDLQRAHIGEMTVKLPLKMADFFNHTSMRAQSLGLVLAFMNQCSGVTAMICYARSVFEKSGSDFSPQISSLIIVIALIVGTLIATSLIDYTGRRKLMITASLGCGIVLCVFGFANVMTDNGYKVFNLIPVICFSMHVFIGTCGPLNLPYIIIPELLPHKIRSITLSYITAIIWILSFLVVKYFYVVAFTYGMYYCLFFFAVSLGCGSIFLFYMLPETMGKRFTQIQRSLNT